MSTLLDGDRYRSAGLRSDERQWLIYDDESVGALGRGLEVMAMSMTGQMLAKHQLKPIRAMGNFMLRIAESRAAEMMRNDGAQRVMIEHLSKVMTFLAGHSAHIPELEIDELWAVTFHADRRAKAAGIQGPGAHRLIVRGD